MARAAESSRCGDSNKVVVIGHEAIFPDVEAVSIGVFGEQIKEEGSVGIGVEDILAAVAALGEVMRDPGDDDARGARHASALGGDEESYREIGAGVTVPVSR